MLQYNGRWLLSLNQQWMETSFGGSELAPEGRITLLT